MVSIMPPSGLLPGGFSGFESRYNHMAINMAPTPDYCPPYKIRKTNGLVAPTPTTGKRRTQNLPPPTATSVPTPTVPGSIPGSLKKCSCPGCQQPKKIDPSVGDGGPPKVRSSTGSELSKPLYVDCSVEYELPMVPKIPSDSQPLLVIHPGWQQKRRITRSSSQQRLQMEQQHRMALQQQYHMYCAQCPPQALHPPPTMPHPVSTATSAPTQSRKRSFDSRTSAGGNGSNGNGGMTIPQYTGKTFGLYLSPKGH